MNKRRQKMTDTKKTKKETSEESKNSEINFPCGNLEEMLRMMKKFRAQGNFDCGAMMKQFMDKEAESTNVNEMTMKMKKLMSEYCRKKRA